MSDKASRFQPSPESRPGQRIPACVVNLDRSPDRLALMRETFLRLGLSFDRLPAVDGGQLSPAERAAFAEAHGPHAWLPGEIGCLLSHHAFWQRVAAGADFAVAVFEDDIRLSPRLATLLANCAWIPADADIVKLESSGQRIAVERVRHPAAEGFSVARLHSQHLRTAGYILTRTGAARLLALFERMNGPVDLMLFDPDYPIFSELRVYQLMPAVCYQIAHDAADRDRARIGSLIQADKQPKPRLPWPQKLAREIARPFRKRAARRAWEKRYARPEWEILAVPSARD